MTHSPSGYRPKPETSRMKTVRTEATPSHTTRRNIFSVGDYLETTYHGIPVGQDWSYHHGAKTGIGQSGAIRQGTDLHPPAVFPTESPKQYWVKTWRCGR